MRDAVLLAAIGFIVCVVIVFTALIMSGSL